MIAIPTLCEVKRGCGWRKPGGLYLVSGSPGEPCAALPLPLDVCPACGHGIKPTRGWTWIQPDHLFALVEHGPIGHASHCPLAAPGRLGERCGLLWIGGIYYQDPLDFTSEAIRVGVSRRITAVPRGFKLGQWVLLAHRRAIYTGAGVCDPDDAYYKSGVFHVFRPSAIQYVVRGDESDEQLQALVDRDITPVRVERAGEQAELSGGDGDGH